MRFNWNFKDIWFQYGRYIYQYGVCLLYSKFLVSIFLPLLLLFHVGLLIIQSVYSLPLSRERWLTAAVVYDGLLVCGDRAGNMHIFKLQNSILNDQENIAEGNKPIQTFTKVHGNIGIQNFIIMGSKLISAGRDGMLKFYESKKYENKKLLHALHKEKMPIDWISGSLKTSDDILILGFKEVFKYLKEY